MSGGCKCRSFPLEGAITARPRSLARFEGPLRAGKRGEKGRKGRENKRRKGRAKTPRNNFFLLTLVNAHCSQISWIWFRSEKKNTNRSPSAATQMFIVYTYARRFHDKATEVVQRRRRITLTVINRRLQQLRIVINIVLSAHLSSRSSSGGSRIC